MIEDIEIWKEYKENYNLEARDFLIEKYLEFSFKFISKIYRKYKDMVNIDQEELYGISSFILIRAIEKFDYKKGINFVKFFSNFAKWLFKSELSKYTNISLRNQSRIIKHLSELIEKNKSNKQNNINTKILKFLLKLSFRNVGYLDEQIKETDLKYTELLKSDDNIENNLEIKELITYINDFINYDLTERERKIIKMKYFYDTELTEISEQLGISLQRCSQIHKKAIEKIRKYLINKIT